MRQTLQQLFLVFPLTKMYGNVTFACFLSVNLMLYAGWLCEQAVSLDGSNLGAGFGSGRCGVFLQINVPCAACQDI